MAWASTPRAASGRSPRVDSSGRPGRSTRSAVGGPRPAAAGRPSSLSHLRQRPRDVHNETDGSAGLPPVSRGVSLVVGPRYRTPSRPVRVGRPPVHRRLSAPAEAPIVSDGSPADLMRFRRRQYHFQFGLATLMGLPPNPTVRTRWGTRTFIRPPEPHQCPRTVSGIGQEPADADGTLGIAAPPTSRQMSHPQRLTRPRTRTVTGIDITALRRTP